MENAKSIPVNTEAVVKESTEKSEVFTSACATMKEENIIEGQRIVANSRTMGKPQTMAAAVAVMKDEIKAEAQRILASPATGESQNP